MATKSVKKSEARQHRITRSNPLPAFALQEAAQRSPSCINSQESENNNQFALQNYDELKLKPEKESTSPLNHEAQLIPHHPLKPMPLTRSKAHLANSNTTPIEILPEPITPEDNEQPQPAPQVDTCRKVSRYALCQSLPQPPAIDSFLTVRKPISRQSEQPSPYSEFRKSYRKQHKREIVSVPYRKCHDALEGRIITIMNKIQGGKNCLKDFESLVEKMGRISSKDLLNRYVVSGIKIIIAIALSKNIYDPKAISRLQQEQTQLQTRIAQQLDSFQEFVSFPQRPQQIDQHEYKPLVMRKLYSTMKRNFPHRSKAEIKRKVVSECQCFFSGEVSVHMLLKFMRARLEGR